MATPTTAIGAEVNRATADLLERLAKSLAGRVYSPRITLLDMHQVCEATGWSPRTIERRAADGTFPKPLQIPGERKWRESTLIAWADRLDPNDPDAIAGGAAGGED